MLALKKKREAEAKAKAEAAAAPPSSSPEAAPMEVDSSTSSSNNNIKKVSLIGAIGGMKKKSEDGAAKNGTKKRTPGEIRIQKGKFVCCSMSMRSLISFFLFLCRGGCHWGTLEFDVISVHLNATTKIKAANNLILAHSIIILL